MVGMFDAAASDLFVGVVAGLIGIPMLYLAMAVAFFTRHRLETRCPKCGWPIGHRDAPFRVRVLHFLSLVAFIPALVISSLGLVAGVVLAVSGDPEWVNVLIVVGVGAPIAFAGAKGFAWYRTFPMQRCGNQVCGWTRQDSAKPVV